MSKLCKLPTNKFCGLCYKSLNYKNINKLKKLNFSTQIKEKSKELVYFDELGLDINKCTKSEVFDNFSKSYIEKYQNKKIFEEKSCLELDKFKYSYDQVMCVLTCGICQFPKVNIQTDQQFYDYIGKENILERGTGFKHLNNLVMLFMITLTFSWLCQVSKTLFMRYYNALFKKRPETALTTT